MPSVKRSIDVNAPAKKAFKIICDFESYPDFLPEIIGVKILKKGAKTATAQFTIKLFTTTKYTLKFQFFPQNKITWSLVESAYMTKDDGMWEIEELKKSNLKLTYSAEISFGWLVPKKIAESLIIDHLPRMMKCFKQRIEHNG